MRWPGTTAGRYRRAGNAPNFTTFTDNPLPVGEARPLTTAERGPDAPSYPRERRDRPTSTRKATHA